MPRDGFDSYWLPQHFGADMLTVIAMAGMQTHRIELGTAVVPTYPRHPVALAQQALTAQVAVGGRLTLGIGVSYRSTVEERRAPATTATPAPGAITRCWPSPSEPATC